MAVKHINPQAKEESGIIVSGKDAKKVATLLVDKDVSKRQFEKSCDSLAASLKLLRSMKAAS